MFYKWNNVLKENCLEIKNKQKTFLILLGFDVVHYKQFVTTLFKLCPSYFEPG